MRRAAKIDNIQPQIVQTFELAGFSVLLLAGVGKGCPDLLIANAWNRTALIEVKSGNARTKKSTKKRQDDFRSRWKGNVFTVRNVDDAVQVILELTKSTKGES